jgi:hypothetical protein
VPHPAPFVFSFLTFNKPHLHPRVVLGFSCWNTRTKVFWKYPFLPSTLWYQESENKQFLTYDLLTLRCTKAIYTIIEAVLKFLSFPRLAWHVAQGCLGMFGSSSIYCRSPMASLVETATTLQVMCGQWFLDIMFSVLHPMVFSKLNEMLSTLLWNRLRFRDFAYQCNPLSTFK